MGKAVYQYSLFIQRSFSLYSQQDFAFKNSLLYSRQFKKFENAIVPNCCYVQNLTSRGQLFPIFHAVLPVDVDLSQCHKFLWSARNGNGNRESTLKIDQPDTLEVFVVLTCVQRNQEQVKQGNLLYEEKICDILFPGSWALGLWEKYLCLWYKNIPIFQRNSSLPEGLLHAEHQHLSDVLGNFSIPDNINIL